MAASSPTRETLLRAYHATARQYYKGQAERWRRMAAPIEAGDQPPPDAESLRRGDLEALTGHRSAADCTAAELDLMVRYLRRQGASDGRARGGQGNGQDRPTDAQWGRIAALGRERGWARGLDDGRLLAFVVRTCRVSAVRFLTRDLASDVILGLERWAVQDAAHSGASNELPAV